MEKKEEFSHRLAELMERKGINQRELERATTISNQAISAWLSGKRKPTLDSIELLWKYFEVDVGFLLGFTDEE